MGGAMTKFNHPKGNAPLAGEANREAKLNDSIIEVAEKLGNVNHGDVTEPFEYPTDVNAITVTLFESKLITAGTKKTFEWDELLRMHAKPRVLSNEEVLPLIKYSALPGNSRASGVIPENITAIVGDYDGGEVPISTAANILAALGVQAFFYTTRRHRSNKPRWRVVAQLAKAISTDSLARYVDALNGALGGILAPESWDPKRAYFYGHLEGVEYEFLESDGTPLDCLMLSGLNWEPVQKRQGEKSQHTKPEKQNKPGAEDLAFDRELARHQATQQTIRELKIALEVIADSADDRHTWNETFLAMMSLKGTPYESEARELIEKWSQNHSEKWCVSDDDSSKWDRDASTGLTYKSIFRWADETDKKNGVYGTPLGWRATSAAADETSADAHQPNANVFSFSDFTSSLKPPVYIWHHVLQKGCLYALTARWGHGKTAIMITVALHVATGRVLGGHATKPERVLYLCGENPEDVRLRTRAAALRFGIDDAMLATQIYFTQRPVSVDATEPLRRFVEEAIAFGPFGLIVIDTGPAHSSVDDEDDNRGMHKLAMAMRDLMEPLGNPATVALMHPTKSATRDTLQPRGGGAFSGSIDGELCAWQEHGKIELFHETKFRGPGFKSIWFVLEKYVLPNMEDNFGNEVLTVLALETDALMNSDEGGHLTGVPRLAFMALKALLDDDNNANCEKPLWAQEVAKELGCAPPVRVETVKNWRAKFNSLRTDSVKPEAARKAFTRSMRFLATGDHVMVFNGMCWIP